MYFLEDEKEFLTEEYVKALGEYTTFQNLLKFHSTLSERTLRRKLQNHSFKFHKECGLIIVNTRSFCEYIFKF